MPRPASAGIASLVQPGRVNQRVYTDPDIFALEMERVFETTWIYAGHESEIPNPGDYIRTKIGLKDVVIVRADEGEILGLINRCAHRGSMVVGPMRGNARSFECPYHGWSYTRSGRLLGVPLPQGYARDFNADDPRWSLQSIPRVEDYRGFIFASLCNSGPDLSEFLEPVRDSLDNVVDRSPAGKLVRTGGHFQQLFHGNWKIHVENTFDAIHPTFLHRSSWASVSEPERQGGEREGSNADQMLQMIQANALPLTDWDQIPHRALRFGHATSGGFYRDSKIAVERQDPWFEDYRRALAAKHGDESAHEILSMDRFNTLIYPNFSLNIRFQEVRRFHPIAADQTILEAFCFRLEGAPEQTFHSAVRFLTSLNSPSSMISQDDLEMFTRMHRVMTQHDSDDEDAAVWVDFSRGRESEDRRNDAVAVAGSTSEMVFRNMWKAWRDYMAA